MKKDQAKKIIENFIRREVRKSLKESYYSNQLKTLDLGSSELITVQFAQSQHKTNWFTLNRESISDIKDFLERLEDTVSEKDHDKSKFAI